MDQTILLHGGRTLIIRSVRKPGKLDLATSGGFVALLPAFGSEDIKSAEALVAELIDLRCVEICCIGPDSEALHDVIDGIVEDKEALHVMTTWHENIAEGCEYFFDTAGSKPHLLLALAADHSELVAMLRKLSFPKSLSGD